MPGSKTAENSHQQHCRPSPSRFRARIVISVVVGSRRSCGHISGSAATSFALHRRNQRLCRWLIANCPPLDLQPPEVDPSANSHGRGKAWGGTPLHPLD